jgi:GNAT superfamily N-acetyltransferase
LNLVGIDVIAGDKTIKMTGIGNVCVDKDYQRNQYGFFLMKAAEYYLRNHKTNGILLCKEKLIPFYDTIRWNRYYGTTLIHDKTFNGFVYAYNALTEKEIIINKNF